MRDRLTEMARERGMTDNELHEFGEAVVEECVKVMMKMARSATSDDLISKGYKDYNSYAGGVLDAVAALNNHFGLYISTRRW